MHTSHQTVTVQEEASSGRFDTSAAFAADPDAHRDACRRLAGLALTYSVGYAAYYGYALAMSVFGDWVAPGPVDGLLFAIGALVGLTTFYLARDARIPAAWFPDYVVVFEVVTSLAIVGELWGWEARTDQQMRAMWAALGQSGDVIGGYVAPLVAKGIRPVHFGGIYSVGMWVLIIPFVVPLSTRRTMLGSALAALTIPGVMLGSLAVHGLPESLRTWGPPLVLDFSLPTLIAAALGVYGSRAHYRLTRELAKAKRMGSYHLVERIGTGGMGEVWRAKHRFLVRPAAIKLIRAEALGGSEGGSGRTARARFEREAQATAALSSPHSIEIYDFGVTDDGTFYYVMELLDGLDLRTLVERFGPVPAERAVHLLRQACHSLADAHARGLVHRDVKPANLFTCRRGLDFDVVKVLDFGLVKRQDDGDRAQLTRDGVANGTPAFMAPEVATGERPVDGRADLYGLGCVAYWLLTGKLVFDGKTGMQVVLRHIRETPEPPSARTELAIPPEVDRLVLDLLEKDPDRRPAGAAALAARLAACEAALPAWTPERAGRWWGAHVPAPAAESAAAAEC